MFIPPPALALFLYRHPLHSSGWNSWWFDRKIEAKTTATRQKPDQPNAFRMGAEPGSGAHRLSLSESSAPGGNRDIVISLVYIFPFLPSQFSFHWRETIAGCAREIKADVGCSVNGTRREEMHVKMTLPLPAVAVLWLLCVAITQRLPAVPATHRAHGISNILHSVVSVNDAREKHTPSSLATAAAQGGSKEGKGGSRCLPLLAIFSFSLG